MPSPGSATAAGSEPVRPTRLSADREASQFRGQSIRRLARRHPLGTISIAILLVFITGAVLAPWIAPSEPGTASFLERLQAPSAKHWFGTDRLGRDVLSRVIFGAQITLVAGIVTAALATVIGATIGLLSGYFGGWLDVIVQRLIDAFMVFPLIVLALALVAILGPGLANVVIAVSIVLIPGMARMIRASVLSVREREYVWAARASGASDMRILLRAVLPNSFAPMIIMSTSEVSTAILAEAALSFLGVGVPPPAPSWGGMLSESRDLMVTAPWLTIFSGLAITLTVFAANMIGDALQDEWDPRFRTGGQL